MTEDEAKIYDLLLRAGPLRAVQIHQTLHMGFHRLYPALQSLRKHDFVQGRKQPGNQLTYELTGLKPTK
ncbi:MULTISPECIES: helix-turn-helix domain-containing protein [unclassified Nostoc]|uniref:helix-turn-helix domain-containing protein n=1 Tax=unclassified Nostoc TaxID=2593658 RepID=UPI002AD5991E|nr:helix-turn-helix domain-containing protein [Nostoc sp. DedQUE03]MDZ7977301.1 helix-turn-helix domain-containing protein [Nostoc sp. DedQUE03]MDZ8048277.1 helix-turn-helix domain-containing protein [Nostoc sp. DedQUE02]